MRLCLIAAMLFPTYLFADPARRDIYGDLLPEGAIRRLGTARLKNPDCERIELSFDGKRVHTVSHNGDVRIWSAISGRFLHGRTTYTHGASSVSRHPNRYFCQSDDGWEIRELDSDRVLRRFVATDQYPIQEFVESDDPDLVATVLLESRSVRVWNLREKRFHDLGRVMGVGPISFLDADRLVVPSFREPTESGQARQCEPLVWNFREGGATTVRAGDHFELDEKLNRSCLPWFVRRRTEDSPIHDIWDCRTHRVVESKFLPGCDFFLRSPNRKWSVVGRLDTELHLWDGKLTRHVVELPRTLHMVFSGDDRALYLFDQALRRIDPRTGQDSWSVPPESRNSSPRQFHWDADGVGLLVEAVSGSDRVFDYYRLDTGQWVDLSLHPQFANSPPGDRTPRSLSQRLPDSDAAPRSIDHRIRRHLDRWVLGWKGFSLPTRESFFESVAQVSPNGDLFVASTPTEREVEAERNSMRVVGDGDDLRVWERITGRCLLKIEAKMVTSFAIESTGRFVATAGADEIRIWSLLDGSLVKRFQSHESGDPFREVTCLEFAPDDQLLASGHADTTVLLWDVSDLPNVPSRSLESSEVKLLWETLGQSHATEANASLTKLLGSPETTLAVLHKTLQPVRSIPLQEIASIVAQLFEPTTFRKREAAFRKLEEMSDAVLEPLHEFLKDSGGLIDEDVRRLKRLVDSRDWSEPPTGIDLQLMRTVRLLELIGGDEALRLLERMGTGYSGARATQEALAALARMRRS